MNDDNNGLPNGAVSMDQVRRVCVSPGIFDFSRLPPRPDQVAAAQADPEQQKYQALAQAIDTIVEHSGDRPQPAEEPPRPLPVDEEKKQKIIDALIAMSAQKAAYQSPIGQYLSSVNSQLSGRYLRNKKLKLTP